MIAACREQWRGRPAAPGRDLAADGAVEAINLFTHAGRAARGLGRA